ncbi:Uncharacterized protein ALO79_03718, partial [Pseudomonas syringae pv. castaneae]
HCASMAAAITGVPIPCPTAYGFNCGAYRRQGQVFRKPLLQKAVVVVGIRIERAHERLERTQLALAIDDAGLNICLATQRPRDITKGVLSQMGTLLVHRLTNDRDREVVERACGEIDRSAAAFLPNLKQGEVAMVGVDFPIPVTIQIARPNQPPISDGPSFQDLW